MINHFYLLLQSDLLPNDMNVSPLESCTKAIGRLRVYRLRTDLKNKVMLVKCENAPRLK